MSEELTKNVANNVANTNSQHLTEQWRNGTLKDGAYYILVDKYEQNEPEIDVGICYNSNFEWWIVKEVLAPMPTYDQFSQMVKKVEKYMDMANKYMNKYNDELKKVEKLEQQLEEAEGVIRLYFKNTQNATYQSLGMNDGYYKKAFMHTVAKEYLEKWGVK